MRQELERAGAWLHVEAACIELTKARMMLQRESSGG